MQKEKLVFYTPHVINPKYFALEFGFLTDKKIKSIGYAFNAFAEAFMAEESYTVNDDLRSGALGFKFGLILPTQPWIPIYLQPTMGYAKTALHEKPWLGKREETVESKDMFFLEGSILFRYDKKILFRYSYQINNIDYFTLKNFVAVGVNF